MSHWYLTDHLMQERTQEVAEQADDARRRAEATASRGNLPVRAGIVFLGGSRPRRTVRLGKVLIMW